MSQYTGTTADKLSEAKHTLREDVQNLKEDAGRLGRDVSHTARDLAAAARTGVREAGHQVSAAIDTARVRGEHWTHESRECVRQHPLTSVGISFGAGLLLGALLRRL